MRTAYENKYLKQGKAILYLKASPGQFKNGGRAHAVFQFICQSSCTAAGESMPFSVGNLRTLRARVHVENLMRSKVMGLQWCEWLSVCKNFQCVFRWPHTELSRGHEHVNRFFQKGEIVKLRRWRPVSITKSILLLRVRAKKDHISIQSSKMGNHVGRDDTKRISFAVRY